MYLVAKNHIATAYTATIKDIRPASLDNSIYTSVHDPFPSLSSLSSLVPVALV